MSSQKSILILCANLKGNLGDFAILEAMGRVLQRHFSDHLISFYYHGNKGVDAVRMPAFESALPPGIQSVGPAPSARRPYFLRKFTKLSMRMGLHSQLQSAGIEKWAEILSKNEEFSTRIREATAVFFAGGSQWGKGDLNMNMFGQLLCASRLNRNVFIFPFSISEALIPCNGSESLREMLGLLSAPLAVRDIETCELLNEIGVPAELFCDSVFALNGVTKIGENSEATKKVYICITSKGGLTAASVVNVIQTLRKQGIEVSLFSTCEMEDRAFYADIKTIMDVDLVAPDSWQEALHCLGKAQFVITNRLHCLIFSSLVETPVIPIMNRVKVRGFARDANIGLSFQSLEEVADADLSLIKTKCAETVAGQKQYVEQSAATLDKMMQQILRTIDETI